MMDGCFFSSISAYGEKIYRNKRLLMVKTDYFWLFYGFLRIFTHAGAWSEGRSHSRTA